MNWQKKLFWDIDLNTVDTEKHAGFNYRENFTSGRS